ncbi:amino acid ABC transporter substrate-binding protein [Shewanella psychropiezotolerans]|uniref:Amino acid ABC transporter substrate-binding protein n=1 Tax=Shewanella psychropiezotolerans TaxID=2593655 RepID=A0ABX5WYN1_9GAMM|nr:MULTISPECIES: transporter substrate-binding domain-containing protein [Shewanella]MPY24701.1 amino acid ABC transporter substrate-binding protein [Shewanella sp. YLB-07]QDO83896.1 amino acid ABC transporter substrate-binding protein [Shewanella psychropiezotolerans]
MKSFLYKYLCAIAYSLSLFLVTIPLAISVENPVVAEPTEHILILGVPLDRPPYVVGDGGIEVDILRQALQLQGYKVEVHKFSHLRLQRELEKGRIDISSRYMAQNDNIALSLAYITFYDVIFTKTSLGLTIDSWADLNGKTFLGWHGFEDDLGDDFKQVYRENTHLWDGLVSQEEQCLHFWKGMADAIILDINIFNWYRKTLGLQGIDTSAPISMHHLLPEGVSYQAGFRDSKVRDAFDKGIAELKESGSYQDIIESYTQVDTK